MVKMVKIKFEEFQRLVKNLKECLRANKALNEEIQEHNKNIKNCG